jgi:2-dehydro-3-deoxygluconokinase
MGKIFCFGELLLRISPASQRELLQNNSAKIFIGGAELNVAKALTQWNVPVSYCTVLPDNYLSKEICMDLKEKNIDTNAINFSGNRIGIYFLPQGTDLKNSEVIYDRNHSSFAELKVGMVDWNTVLEGISWFHFSAINPALNDNIAKVCIEALEVASKKNITISVDLNYRSKLWKYGKGPIEIMPELVKYCDVIMGNIWSANTLLGIHVDDDIHNKGKKTDYLEHAKQTAIAIQKQFPECKTVANTFRFDNEDGINYYASLFSEREQYHSIEFKTNKVIDKVGSGDCFMAGLIYGLSKKYAPQDIINFAASAAFGKLHEAGDATKQSVETIKARIRNNG